MVTPADLALSARARAIAEGLFRTNRVGRRGVFGQGMLRLKWKKRRLLLDLARWQPRRAGRSAMAVWGSLRADLAIRSSVYAQRATP